MEQKFKIQVMGILSGSKTSGEEVQVTEEAFVKALAGAIEDHRVDLEKTTFKSGNRGFFAAGNILVPTKGGK